MRASIEQVSSHTPLQHSLSTLHTHVLHVPSSQLGPPCPVQQSPPGVGVGPGVPGVAGVSVGSGAHGQLAAHSTCAREMQVASHTDAQQVGSCPHTQA